MEKNTAEEKRFEVEIALSDFKSVFIKNLLLIGICTLACGILIFIYNAAFVAPVYRSEVMFYIVPVDTDGGDYNESVKLQLEAQGLSYAKQIQNTYFQIFNSRAFKTKLEEEYEKKYKKPLDGRFNVLGITDTQLFKIQATSRSKESAYEMAAQIEVSAPEIIIEITSNDTIRIVDGALMPEKPINDNTLRNTIAGMVLGAIVSYGVLFTIFVFDKRIKSEEDLKHRYDVPVLGGIIDFGREIKHKKENRRIGDG